jgi:hypothetical protein
MKAATGRGERVEGVVLVLILLTVGGLAGAASFTHVHDWTMANSPAGTGDWFGWANAAISELIPVAALLTVRRRRRTGGSVAYPMVLLVAAVALSLSAQLAVAKPGLSGALLSAVPALAFMGLSKLVLSAKPTPQPSALVSPPVTEDGTDTEPVTVSPADDQEGAANSRQLVADLVTLPRPHIAEGPDNTQVGTGRPALVPVPAAAFARNGSRNSQEG